MMDEFYNIVTGEHRTAPPYPGTYCSAEEWAKYEARGWRKVGAGFARPRTAEEIASETQRELESAVDAFMDSKARVKGFRDRHSFALRAGIPGSSWHAQALVFGAWMDAVNDYCYQVQLDCLDGKRTVPTVDELLAELPVLEVP
jgi:hypothetical protein